MVSFCDSWQTKAEKAAERRTLSKENKHQRDRRRLNKTLAQGLITFLQEKNHSILLSASTGTRKNYDLNIHVWTEATPMGHPFMDLLTDEGRMDDKVVLPSPSEKGKGRPRSNSYNDRPPASPMSYKNGRDRSNSDVTTPVVESSKKPKGRPRSGSTASDQSSSEDNKSSPRLCVDHFFGDCFSALLSRNGGSIRRKSGNSTHPVPRCAHGFHPLSTNGNPSLASILLKQSKADTASSPNRLESNINTLTVASQVAKKTLTAGADITTTSAGAGGGMGMLYHLHSKIPIREMEYSPATHSYLLVDELSNVLAKYVCPIASVVYVSINDVMVFDRYRDGIVLNDADEELLLYGGSKRRSVPVGENADCKVKERRDSFFQDTETEVIMEAEDSVASLHQRLVQYLPGIVLGYILSYLPDSSTAFFPQVCKAWRNEIGNASRGLWTHLMDRKKWPHAHIEISDLPGASTEPYRDTFVKHYTAVRDVNAIMQGLVHVLAGTDSSVASKEHKDVALFNFKDSISSSIPRKTFIRKWSSSRVLVGSDDCTLHLYDIVDTSSGGSKRCKQSVRVRAAPFAISRNKNISLVGLDLDNDSIGCVYSAVSGFDYEYWFSLIERDELLCAGKGGSQISDLDNESLKSYDMMAMILNFLQSSSEKRVSTWLDSHPASSDTSGFELSLSENLVACGNGEFLFEAHVIYEDVLNYDRDVPTPVLSKVFLFSTVLEQITWVSPDGLCSHFTLCKLPKEKGMVSQDEGGHEGPHTYAFADAAFILGTGEIVKLHVQGPGDVQCVRSSLALGRPYIMPSLVGLSQNNLLFSDYSSINFMSMDGTVDFGDYQPADKNNFREVVSLQKEYFIVFCSRYEIRYHDADFDDTDEEDEEDEPPGEEVIATLHHIPSRKEIHRVTYTHKHGGIPRFSFSTECEEGSVAMSVDGLGLLVAGHRVSSLENESWQRKTKRKKASRTNKGKRDIFARGMRQTMG